MPSGLRIQVFQNLAEARRARVTAPIFKITIASQQRATSYRQGIDLPPAAALGATAGGDGFKQVDRV